jgi:hypothetical protein
VLLFALTLIAMPSGALAVTYEEPSPFCEGETVRDYLAPLQRMPALHSPPKDERIDFGPKSVVFRRTPSLVVGKGSIGYTLSLHWRAPSAHPRWEITTTLSKVDWQGRVTDTVDRTRRFVFAISRKHSVEASFDVGRQPAVYRLTVAFQSKSGRKLGGYGFYSRVVPATKHAQLSLNSDTYAPETTVFGRLENFGTEPIFFGADYVIERLEGSSWVRAPESPREFILPLYFTEAGVTSRCSPFRIRPTMSGRYRMAKGIEYGTWPPPRNGRPVILTAEFDVTP